MTVEALPSRDVIWRPHPGAQTRLLTCPYNEILYGGAKGGGKSDGIEGSWLGHAARNPKWARGIIFRKTLPQLEQLINRSKELFTPLGARWQAQPKTWFFPGGATLKFRYLETVTDALEYQGHEYTWEAFDEVGDLADEAVINTLRGALRSSKPITERVLLLCGNPMGVGHKWLKRRFIDPAPPEVPMLEKRTFTFNGRKVETLWSRVFIPALLEDNPTLLANDPGYPLRLEQMCVGKPWLYRALRFGDWTVKRESPGALWTEALIEKHRIDKRPTLRRAVVGVDPSVKGYDVEKSEAELMDDAANGLITLGDMCGIVGAGEGIEEIPCTYTLADYSMLGDPTVWSRRAVECAIAIGASVITAEDNNGGQLVKIEIDKQLVLMKVRGITVELVPARVGKYIRASPIAADMINDLDFDVGYFPELTEERTTFVPSIKKASPNRLDAYVWAKTYLTQGRDTRSVLDYYRGEASKLPDDVQQRIRERQEQFNAIMKRGRG